MWSGTITIGLLNVPVTIGKAWADEREKGLRDFCATHKIPVTRNERCESCSGAPEGGKVKGVEGAEGKLHFLNENEMAGIEDSTKSPTLNVLDVQPLDDLPMEYVIGTYYLRADKKVPGSDQPFAILCDALAKTGFALVSKWCNASKQKLVFIHEHNGILCLRHLPMANEIRLPGEQETRHQQIAVADSHVDMAVKLLKATKGRKKFNHAAYEDEGLNLRREAVELLLNSDGEDRPEQKNEQEKPAPDIMAALSASLDAVKAEA
jgi:DNA end-binding protein Ku